METQDDGKQRKSAQDAYNPAWDGGDPELW